MLGGIGTGPGAGSNLRLALTDSLRLAWADPDLRRRLQFVLFVFGVYAFGVHVPVPVPGIAPGALEDIISQFGLLGLINVFGGGALSRVSILSLGLAPYISASIAMQVLTAAIPAWKQELQEGGEYARRQQNRRTRALTLFLCVFQGLGLIQLITGQTTVALTVWQSIPIILFWTTGSMLLLYLGEQVSEKGIGNGVSLLIFAGIVISFPSVFMTVIGAVQDGTVPIWSAMILVVLFLATTMFIVYFATAQRRVPIQHMRRQIGTQAVGGHSSYLPVAVNMAGVIPVIFAITLIYLPAQFALIAEGFSPTLARAMEQVAQFFAPNFTTWTGFVSILVYAGMIFFFTYFWNALIYNVEDISNNLKRAGSYIPGIRPGKQTKDFLDGVISRVTFVGAVCLAIVAMTQFLFPLIADIQDLAFIGGTSLLIMVSVALETMRQIESNILSKQYGQ